MGTKRIIPGFTAFLSALLLFFILLLSSIEWVSFDIGFYKKEYRKLKRAEAIGISEKELILSTREILKYLRDQRDDLKIEATIKGNKDYIFNQREIEHMVDVKQLFSIGFTIRNIAIAGFLALIAILYFYTRKDFIRIFTFSFERTAAALLLLSLVLIILISTNFTAYWDQFHRIFFNNDLWQLDPKTDILIQIVPEQFFFDTVQRIILLFLSEIVFLGLVFRLALYFSNKKKSSLA